MNAASAVVHPEDVIVEDTGEGAYQVEVRADGLRFLADEPVEVGGLGSGPAPYQMLGAALAPAPSSPSRCTLRASSGP